MHSDFPLQNINMFDLLPILEIQEQVICGKQIYSRGGNQFPISYFAPDISMSEYSEDNYVCRQIEEIRGREEEE